MHAVVLHPLVDAQARLVPLASLFGTTPYELRPRLNGAGPAVIEVFGEAGPARDRGAALQAAGVPHFLLEPQAIARHEGPFQGRSFTLDADALTVQGRDGQQRRLPWEALRLVLVGMRSKTTEHSEESSHKQFSASRSLASGGLINSRRVVHKRQVSEQERERVMVLCSADGPVALGELSVQYQGLGSDLQPARAANFTRLLARLRAAAPAATIDDRLLRRPGQTAVLGRLDPERHLPVAFAALERALLP